MRQDRGFYPERRLLILRLHKAAGRQKAIDSLQAAGEKTACPPWLRKPVMSERTAEARPLRTGLLIELEQNMGGTDEPVIMQRAEPHSFRQLQSSGTANQRKIMPVHHVEIPRKNRFQTF